MTRAVHRAGFRPLAFASRHLLLRPAALKIAASIVLTLLALGVKRIYLGPTLPAFLSETVVKTLVDAYGLQPITAPEQDLDAIQGRG